ncbi:MAG: tail protein X [Planctomycetota bacterium]
MDRGVKVVLASVVLGAGIALAMLFRHPTPQARTAEPPSHDKLLVLRQQNGPAADAPTPPDRLTALSGPSSEAPREPQTPDLRASDPASIDSGAPPPRLARSYPDVSDEWTSGGDPSRRSGIPRTKPSIESAGTHKIVDGDTLRDLAERYLGDGNRYLEIFEANRDLLPSANVLPIGVELKIPPQQGPGSQSP